MAQYVRWTLIGLIVFVIAVVPVMYYRMQYAHGKRLRVVTPGKVYRSGQLTSAGFRDAIRKHKIKTVVNLQDEYPDPLITRGYFDRGMDRETDLCEELGVKYVFIAPDLLPRRLVPANRPRAIEEMLAVFDDPSNYPILVHCRAGLHRTGCMLAIYRMEYQQWTPEQAIDEMKAHGFGDSACTLSNDYVYQYVGTYRRGVRQPQPPRIAIGADHK